MQWLMLQQDEPEDFVIATGVQYSVRQFVEMAAAELGIRCAFDGEGEREIGHGRHRSTAPRRRCKPGQVIVRVDPRYFRPTEVETLLGDAEQGQAQARLDAEDRRCRSWCARWSAADYDAARRDGLVKSAGFQAYDYHE